VNYRTLAINAGTAFLAQGVAMALSIIQTLLVPKLLGSTQYGYWQLFLFYQSYVGFAHLGLNDGIYLIKGGQPRDIIDKRSVNSQFTFGVLFQLVLAAIIVVVALGGGFGPDREFVIVCTGIFLVIQNAATYLMYILQAMNETRRSSYSTIVERLTFLVPLVVLLVVRYHSYQPFVISYIFSSVVQLAYCSWFCRDFFKAGLEPVRQAAGGAWGSIRVGFKLMVANIASQLVLGIARFAIDAAWGIDTFGKLSLSLSLVNFFLAFVSQASMVLFPALRQVGLVEAKGFFVNVRDTMSLFFPLIYVLYYPMVWILSWWLPKYANSFVYFILLIPVCVFDSKMNICCTTFFKVLRKEGTLLKVNVCTCASSAVLTLLGVYGIGSIFWVIGGVVVAIVGRSLWSEARLTCELAVPSDRAITVGELALTVVFVATAFILPGYVALGCYCVAYAVFLFAFRSRVGELLRKMRRVVRRG
jgi:O-antigen/teichoic acid export membrane protein